MELKTIKLQGKDYVQVAERIKYFRETVKDGRIETEVNFNPEHTRAVFIAKIYVGDKLISTAHSLKNIAKEFELEKKDFGLVIKYDVYGVEFMEHGLKVEEFELKKNFSVSFVRFIS